MLYVYIKRIMFFCDHPLLLLLASHFFYIYCWNNLFLYLAVFDTKQISWYGQTKIDGCGNASHLQILIQFMWSFFRYKKYFTVMTHIETKRKYRIYLSPNEEIKWSFLERKETRQNTIFVIRREKDPLIIDKLLEHL